MKLSKNRTRTDVDKLSLQIERKIFELLVNEITATGQGKLMSWQRREEKRGNEETRSQGWKLERAIWKVAYGRLTLQGSLFKKRRRDLNCLNEDMKEASNDMKFIKVCSRQIPCSTNILMRERKNSEPFGIRSAIYELAVWRITMCQQDN